MSLHSKVYSKQSSSTYFILAFYSQQCFVTTLLHHIAFMRNVLCFNGFNETAIVFHDYSAHIKPRKTIKTIKTENITHKHNMTLTVSS